MADMVNAELVLTNNFYAWARTILFSGNGTNDVSGGAARNIIGTVKKTDGASAPGICFMGGSTTSYGGSTIDFFQSDNGTNPGRTRVMIGSDNTATQKSDYRLHASDTGNIQITLTGNYGMFDETKGGVTIQASIRNTSTSSNGAKTIGEIGLFKYLYQNQNSAFGDVMLGRATFDEKITLKPGETRLFNLTIGL